MNWNCKHTWKKASVNTLWCLLGCSIGDFGTIFYFQSIEHSLLTWQIMGLAITNGLLTSILLETFILFRQMNLKEAFKVAIGMSFISMIAMEASMNVIDVLLTGGAKLTLSANIARRNTAKMAWRARAHYAVDEKLFLFLC